MYSFQDALAAHGNCQSSNDKTIDIEEQQRLFFSKFASNGASSSALEGFSFSRLQLEEGLTHAAPAHEDCLGLPHEREPELNSQIPAVGAASVSPLSQLERRIIHLPAEIQLQIIDHYTEPPKPTECGFCHLFALATACQVNRLWYHYAMRRLYSVIALDISNCVSTCSLHFHLDSKHVQMGTRIPALVRTLESRPDLASMVKTIKFPNSRRADWTKDSPGALAYWVTCALEKIWLPKLIRMCDQLEGVCGLEDVLSQLFNGEHFCLYENEDEVEEHGFVAQALVEKRTFKNWVWGRGYVRKLGDRVAGNYNSFLELHRNWVNLEHLAIVGLSGVEADVMKETLEGLPALKALTIGLGGKKGDLNEVDQARYLSNLLPILPVNIEKVKFVDVVSQTFLREVVAWADDCVAAKIASGKSVFPPVRDTQVSVCPSPSSSWSSMMGWNRGLKGTRVVFTLARETFAGFWQACRERENAGCFRVMVREGGVDKDVEVELFF
ncbi:hypothetical protein DFH27DRAFT_94797 [Peziza echinospora]|nr:hypothetical protein DFH27DRAFT_94797 [Peziza echinospora]